MRFRRIFQPVAKHHFTAYSLKCIIPSGCDSPWKPILFLVLLLRTSKTGLQKKKSPKTGLRHPPLPQQISFCGFPFACMCQLTLCDVKTSQSKLPKSSAAPAALKSLARCIRTPTGATPAYKHPQ